MSLILIHKTGSLLTESKMFLTSNFLPMSLIPIHKTGSFLFLVVLLYECSF